MADRLVAFTPTPNPSPQGGGGFASVVAKFPSPLRGGVRGGGMCMEQPNQGATHG